MKLEIRNWTLVLSKELIKNGFIAHDLMRGGSMMHHGSRRPLSLKKKGENSNCSIPISLRKSNEVRRYNSMNEKKVQDMPLSSKADAAFRQAAKKIIQRARQTDTPVVVWEEGHIKKIPGEEFEITMAAMELREPRP
jgi:hypothetical protein